MKPHTTINTTFKATIMLTILWIVSLMSACQEPIDGPDQIDPTMITPEASFIVGPAGGYFSALEGNVTLYFPQEALTGEVRFLIQEGPEDEEGDFVIRSITIEPNHLEFLTPVSIALRYDGCLSNGQNPCKAKCLALYYFENDKTFDARKQEDMKWIEQCCLNTMDRCIETKIQGGGVYAIGEASMDPTKH